MFPTRRLASQAGFLKRSADEFGRLAKYGTAEALTQCRPLVRKLTLF